MKKLWKYQKFSFKKNFNIQPVCIYCELSFFFCFFISMLVLRSCRLADCCLVRCSLYPSFCFCLWYFLFLPFVLKNLLRQTQAHLWVVVIFLLIFFSFSSTLWVKTVNFQSIGLYYILNFQRLLLLKTFHQLSVWHSEI